MRSIYCRATSLCPLALILLSIATPVWAQPNVTATLEDTLINDVDSDGLADPGDTIQYRVVITNSGDDAEGVSIEVLLDTLTTLVPGSLTSTPLAFEGSFTTDEDTPVTVTLVGADVEGDALAFAITQNPASGSLGAVTPLTDTTAEVTYTPEADFNGEDTFTFSVDDNGDGTAEATVTVTVTAVNDAPSFTVGADQSVAEDAGAQTATDWATNISAGPANESGQTLTFNVTGNTNAALFDVAPAVSTDGALTYTPAAGVSGSADITLELQDDGGTANGGEDTSSAQTFTITVNGVNDAPSFTAGADETVPEDAGAQTIANWATAINAGATDESGQTLTFNVTGNTNAALFAVAPAVSSDGTLTYTPAADANGSADITLELQDDGGTANGGEDTSVPQTFTINVTAVNDAPNFTAGADQTVLEDAAPQSVAGWATGLSAGPADESGQALTFNVTGNTNAALFEVAPAVSSDGTLTYILAVDANGSADITLELQDDGGTANGGNDTSAAQTFTISVTPVNDAPSFTVGSDQTVPEDSGPQSVMDWATNISAGPADESGQTLTFNVLDNSNPGLFSAGPAISSDGTLTFTPAADANGSANISILLQDDGGTDNGGENTTDGFSFLITVTPVNDVPTFTGGPDLIIQEDAGPVTETNWATNISAGPSDEAGQTLTFNVTNNTNPGLFSAGPAISSDGTLAFTPAADANGDAMISYVLQDDGGTANGGDDTTDAVTFTISIPPINDAPSFTAGADQTVLEDAGAQSVAGWATGISAGPADESGQTLSFNVTGNTNSALFSAAPAISSDGTLTYTPAADANGSADITLALMDDGGTANGGNDTSLTQSFTITVTAVNDEPSFTAGSDETVLEDAGAQMVSNWATNISAGAPDESGQALTFNVSNDNNALFDVQPAISSDGTLTYTPAADANGSATVTVSLQDDGGTANGGDDTSASVNFTITVTAVNDAPSFAKGADQMATEDSGAVTAAGWATFISTGPADESAQTTTFNITGNTTPALFDVAPAVNASTGDLTYTVASGAFGTATITLTLSDNGGTANGGVDTSAAQTFDITVVEVPDDRSYTALAHTELAAGGFTAIATPNTTDTNGVLVGDPSLTVTSTTPITSTNGGSVTMAADGSFSYTPPPGVTGTAADSFDYTVDTGASATVTLTINGTPTWYVNNQASAGGNGTSSAPYDTLAAAATASSAGDTIYVFEGDGTSTGYAAGVTLKDNQALLGQGEDLVINSTTLVTGNTANRSFIQNALGTAVTLASNNTVAGLKIQSSLQGIAATGQSGTLLLDNLDLQGNTNEEIDLLNHAGTVTIQNSTIVCTVVPALLVDGGDAAITVDNVSLTHAGGPGIQIQNRTGGSLQYINGSIMQTNTEAVLATNSAGTYRFDNITQTGSGRGISISNCGTANFTFNNLSVTNNSTLASLHLSGAGLVSVAGTSSLSNAGGPAINALNTTFDTTGGGGSAVFSSVSSGGSNLGVNLQATAGTLTINGGTLGSTLKILQGDVDVTYNGTISTTSGKALDVQSMSGGDVTIGGAVTSTGGTGITVSGNTLASNEVSVAGTTTLTNTTGTALTAENNVSGTLRFAALNIDNSTSSQRGILAGNNGTFSLVNTGGSVNSGSLQAIGISNTGIMLTFQSVSAANASTGIGLNNTPGSFTVTGVGTTDGSGGTIQNITNNGIELISAENISLSNMTLINANLTDNCGTEAYDETGGENCRGAVYLRDVTGITLDNVDINDTSEMGITGTSVRGLALTDSSITNAGNSTSESGILLRDLLGTTAGGDANLIQNTSVTNSAQIGVFIRNLLRTNAPGGAFDRLLMDNVTVTQSGDNTAADNVTISLRDNASNQGSNFQVAVQNCTFTGTNGQIADAIQFDTGVNATGDFSISGTTTNNCNTGINVSAANSSTTTFLVNNNTNINVDGGQGVNVACNGTAVMSGTISNNTIDSFNANNPGFGIDAVADATGTLTIDIDNNNVTDFSIPVRAGARNSGTGTANISITDNTMSSGGGFAFGVLWVFSGNGSGGESNVVCANISGNNFNDPFGTQEYYIEQYPGNTLNLQGYTGLASSQAAIQTFLEGNNVAGDALVETCCGTSANVGNATCSTP